MNHDVSFGIRDLLCASGIELPKHNVLMMRHRPTEPLLRKMLPWIAAEEPDVYNAYQQTQTRQAEQKLARADYLLSFIGHEAGRGLFVGLYKVGNRRAMTYDDYWKVPEYIQLKSKGLTGFTGDRSSVLWFELTAQDSWAKWKGKLVVEWTGGERSWCRWASANNFPIFAIHEDSQLAGVMPRWDELVLSWDELHSLPKKWQDTLKHWRGVYYIYDQSERLGYVGSASGEENLFGRWQNYQKSSDGGNVRLRKRDPRNFKFSILELLSHEEDVARVVAAENRWKERLHSKAHGLNVN